MTLTDWENVTNYIDTVGTTLKTFTFSKPQDFVKVTTKGSASITYTIGTQTGTLTPGQSIEVSEAISNFTLTATSGTQTIEVFAKEDGTKKEEDNSNDVMSQLADIATQSITTTFNSDGSITESYASGLIKTTTFNSDGTITEVYSAPINKTKIITFNSDGSISEVVS